jgi:hypothetical protein
MDHLAVEQAKARLQRAKKAIQALEAADSYEAAESAWTDFLLSASTIYSKLEQGSKSNGQSQGWFGRKKKERRDDPLLRYLHFARNSDEHGVELVVERGGNQFGFGGRKLKFNEREACTIHQLDENKNIIPGTGTPAFMYGPSIQLVRVFDRRFNESCEVPTHHLGKAIDLSDASAHGIGSVAIRYFDGLLLEAEALSSKAIAT